MVVTETPSLARVSSEAGLQPRDWVVAGHWPDGDLDSAAPTEAVYAAHIAQRLRAALATTTLKGLCRQVGLNRSTVQDLLAGRSYGSVSTVAKLEAALGARLWPEGDQSGDA